MNQPETNLNHPKATKSISFTNQPQSVKPNQTLHLPIFTLNQTFAKWRCFFLLRPTLQPFVLESNDPIPENPFQEVVCPGDVSTKAE